MTIVIMKDEGETRVRFVIFIDLDWHLKVLQRQITRQWYKTELYLQWQTGRKSYMVYRILPFSLTLNDP